MDINQLKLILDALDDTTELAAAVAIAWVVASEVLPLLLGAFAVYTVSRIVNYFIGAGAFSNDDTRSMREIRDSMFPRERGTYFDASERAAVRRRLDRLKEAGMFETTLPDLSRKSGS